MHGTIENILVGMKMGNKKVDIVEISAIRAGLSEYPRPASGARGSTLDTQLHPSGNFSVSKENGGVKKVSDIPIIYYIHVTIEKILKRRMSYAFR